MNRSDLVSYITTKSGLVEPEDITACQLFLNKRYELIFNSYLWKDTLGAVDITVDPYNPDNAEGIVLLPEVIDRVVGVRTTRNAVRITALEDFYNIDFDQFQQQGVPYQFSILSPVWFVWRGYLGLQISSESDANTQFKVTWRDNLGKRYVQNLANGSLLSSTAPANAPNDTGVILVSGAGDAAVNGVYVGSGTTYTKVADARYRITINNDGTGLWILFVGQILYGLANTLNPVSNKWTWQFFDGDAPAPITTYAPQSRIEIESMFKPVTNGDVSLNPQIAGDASGGTLGLSETASPQYIRLRLISIPTIKTTLTVLGKKKFVPLDFDQEVPAIRNCDNCLIAFTMADMLIRGRQYSKAQAQEQEGGILLQELAKLEAIQAANYQRFIPFSGFADPFTGPNQGPWNSWGGNY